MPGAAAVATSALPGTVTAMNTRPPLDRRWLEAEHARFVALRADQSLEAHARGLVEASTWWTMASQRFELRSVKDLFVQPDVVLDEIEELLEQLRERAVPDRRFAGELDELAPLFAARLVATAVTRTADPIVAASVQAWVRRGCVGGDSDWLRRRDELLGGPLRYVRLAHDPIDRAAALALAEHRPDPVEELWPAAAVWLACRAVTRNEQSFAVLAEWASLTLSHAVPYVASLGEVAFDDNESLLEVMAATWSGDGVADGNVVTVARSVLHGR